LVNYIYRDFDIIRSVYTASEMFTKGHAMSYVPPKPTMQWNTVYPNVYS